MLPLQIIDKHTISILEIFYSKLTSHYKLVFAFDVIFLGNPFSHNKSVIVYISLWTNSSQIYIEADSNNISVKYKNQNCYIRIIGEIYPTFTPKKILGKIQKTACASTFQSFNNFLLILKTQIYIQHVYQKVYTLPLMSSADDWSWLLCILTFIVLFTKRVFIVDLYLTWVISRYALDIYCLRIWLLTLM